MENYHEKLNRYWEKLNTAEYVSLKFACKDTHWLKKIVEEIIKVKIQKMTGY